MDVEILDHYYYTKEHEWVYVEDSMATIGLSEYAQSALGDVTFIELPEVGVEVEQFEEFASIESVKAASDIYSPMSGRIVEVNSELEDDPGRINKDCYEKGWIVKLELSDLDEMSELMKADEYRNFLSGVK
ncbi:MAG: glycine cleavage system protein GcvH [Candidatus Omnitrophica bacterium]|nr:glycine cleavage system protein GcvH [Candidatus Omnitrophota bacterium]